MEGHVKAHYIGSATGETFIEACKNLMKQIGRGEVRFDENGNKYVHDWGCRWFPTLNVRRSPKVMRLIVK